MHACVWAAADVGWCCWPAVTPHLQSLYEARLKLHRLLLLVSPQQQQSPELLHPEQPQPVLGARQGSLCILLGAQQQVCAVLAGEHLVQCYADELQLLLVGFMRAEKPAAAALVAMM